MLKSNQNSVDIGGSSLSVRGLGDVVVTQNLQPLRSPVRISARALHVGKLVVTCLYAQWFTMQNLDQLVCPGSSPPPPPM